MPIEFQEFPKICRMSRECIITEKIDGTNACIYIGEDGSFLVGSRTRWLTPETGDNYGFLLWAMTNKEKLMQLGPGRHFGEWWGSGIQRGYGLPKGEKRLSLFNVSRWCLYGHTPLPIPQADPRMEKFQDVLPEGIYLVPELYHGMFTTNAVDDCVEMLRHNGSMASPGFKNPEGVVCFHTAGNFGMKKTLVKDESPKGNKSHDTQR